MPESPTNDSPIPPELRRSPRVVRRKAGTLLLVVVGRILTAPILAAAVGLVGLAVFEPVVVFLIPGQPARVVGKGETDGKRQAGYYVEYRFDRSGFTARDQILPGEYSAFAVGQAISAHVVHLGPVGYATLDRSWPAYRRYRSILWFGTVFASVIGGVLFYGVWLLPWRAWGLVRNGEAAFGAVVAKSIIRGPRRFLHFTLTYQFKARGELRATKIHISPQRYDATGVKDLVIILFDPNRPSRNIVYDYCDFIAS
jgi:hypothetical protein